MNDKILEFIQSMGVITETWLVIYQGFLSNGLSKEDSLMHTQAVFEAILKTSMLNGNGDKKNDSDD